MICEITCPYCQGPQEIEFATDDQGLFETCCEGCDKRFRIQSMVDFHVERDCSLNHESHELTTIRGKDGEGIVRYTCAKCDVLKFESEEFPEENPKKSACKSYWRKSMPIDNSLNITLSVTPRAYSRRSFARPTVVFDLDSTLNDLHVHIYKAIRDKHGIDLHYDKWVHYNLSKNYPLSLDDIYGLIESGNLLMECKPLPGAAELFADLKARGFKIGIVTARKCFDRCTRAVTEEWLNQHNLNPDWLEIVAGKKHEAIQRRTNNCVLFIDDNPQHLLDVYNSGCARQVAAVAYAWNVGLPVGIERFENLKSVSLLVEGVNDAKNC